MLYSKYRKSHFTFKEIYESLVEIYKNMRNDKASIPNKIDSNKTYQEQVNKNPPYKVKGSESRPNYCLSKLNQTKLWDHIDNSYFLNHCK